MPHIHISTGFALVASVATVGLVGSVLLFVRSIRKDKLDAAALRTHYDVPPYGASVSPYGEHWYHEKPTEALLRERGYITPAHDAIRRTSVPSSGGYVHERAAAPVHYVSAPPAYYGPPGYVGIDPSLAMVEGMLIGEALGGAGHHHDTTVNNTYVDNYSDVQSSSSYGSSASDSYSAPSSDSGFSYSDGGSSFSDSGLSGGCDISW